MQPPPTYPGYTARMDRLWTPWRYAYISKQKPASRPGVPAELDGYPEDHASVFLNLIGAVRWAAEAGGFSQAAAEKAGGVLLQSEHNFVCLNAFPYTSGHIMVVPYLHLDSLAKLPTEAAVEMMALAQRLETMLREVYRPDGINLGMNLGEAAGAGVAEHLHLHILPRWFGDSNFMTATAETRILPESLDQTWERLRKALGEPVQ
ncbi:MAG: HIT family protein [Janthinobacterium lividum]